MDATLPDLGDLEREVMQLVWTHAPVTAEAVRERLGRPLKESTVRTVLRRLECVLAPTRDKVLDTVEKYRNRDIDADRFLRKASGHRFYNTTPLTLKSIKDDPSHVARNLTQYVGGFSPNAYEVLERYEFAQQIKASAEKAKSGGAK